MLRRLAFIRAARNVGLSLDEIARARQAAGRPHPDPRRLEPVVQRLARAPGRSDRRADGAARQPGLVHRLRLPVAEALRHL